MSPIQVVISEPSKDVCGTHVNSVDVQAVTAGNWAAITGRQVCAHPHLWACGLQYTGQGTAWESSVDEAET